MTIFDSSGIEAWVTENNPKYANRIIKQLKAYAKAMHFDENYDPYKAAYSSMPSHASANPDIKQLYIDGHFCYAYKFGIVTNGLGIVRHIDFYNRNFFENHPEIILEKKSDSPDEDKSVHDARLLIPTCLLYTSHPADLPECRTGTGRVITWRGLRFQAYRAFRLIGRTGILFFRSRTTAGYSCKPFYQKGIPKGQTAQEDALPEAQVFKPDRFQKERLAGTVRQAESRIPFESD